MKRLLFIFIIRTTCVHSFNHASCLRAFLHPRIFNATSFTPLPLSPWSSPHVSVILSLYSRFLLCLSPILRHIYIFSAVFIGLQSPSGTVIVSTDLATDSPLGAASFLRSGSSFHSRAHQFTAAHLNISSKSWSFIERLTALLNFRLCFSTFLFFTPTRARLT